MRMSEHWDTLLLERIEQEIIRRRSFGIDMTATESGLVLDCDMKMRGKVRVCVERREGRWTITDACATVRKVGWLWNRMPLDVLEICERNGVQELDGEIWVHVDSDEIYMALCAVLCTMLELRNLANHNNPKGT